VFRSLTPYNNSVASIPIGTKGESSIIVTPETAVSFLGAEGARVLGTPFLIFHLEMTSRDSVKPFLEEGFDTVGARVDVRHLAATPLGMHVTFRSELTGIDNRRLFFQVEAFDEKDKISEGTHERAIIQVAKFAARVQSKGRRD
jgi:fluoroacetyl-CoA thioesterase